MIIFVFLLSYKLFCQYLCEKSNLGSLPPLKKKKIPSLINKNITQRQTNSKTKRSKTSQGTLLPLLRQYGRVKMGSTVVLGCDCPMPVLSSQAGPASSMPWRSLRAPSCGTSTYTVPKRLPAQFITQKMNWATRGRGIGARESAFPLSLTW